MWESMMDYNDNDDTASQLPDRLLTLQETEHMHHVVVSSCFSRWPWQATYVMSQRDLQACF